MYNFTKVGNVEVITNMGLGDLDKVLKEGFKVVNPVTWEEVGLGYKFIHEAFNNGEIDLIRNVG